MDRTKVAREGLMFLFLNTALIAVVMLVLALVVWTHERVEFDRAQTLVAAAMSFVGFAFGVSGGAFIGGYLVYERMTALKHHESQTKAVTLGRSSVNPADADRRMVVSQKGQ